MSNNNFTISIIAALNNQLSRQQIKKDLKTIDNSLYVKIISKLAIALSRKQLNKDLKKLNNLYLQIGAGMKTDRNTKQKLQTQIKQLQQNLEDLQLKVGVKKADSSNVKQSVSSSIKEAQQYANGSKIRLDVEVRKEKAVNDILYIGKKYSKLFSNVAATQKYENLLASSYSISDEEQLRSVRNQISAFTSELRANGLAMESTGAKWRKLVNRAEELFSAATVVSTIFSQVKKSISTFLQLDTAMTNLYKVQDNITSRDQFSGMLTRWNKLAQNLAVTTESLISSMEAWSKIGFNLDMSEQLAQITSIFEKTAEISNKKATSTLISAAQAFTEIDDLGVDDYIKRVEAVGNKINAIGNRYAIDSEGISDGLQNASAALKMAGNDLNETISLITATNKIYQSPEEGANMLKVASMRLRGQVDALQEMGEDTEGVSADITKIQQQIYELTGNKVNIFENEDTLKSTYQMILEIGEVFDSLSDRQQADLLEKMFGKQRSSAGAALLLNYEELEKIKSDSINAGNSMAEEYSKYMESAEAHITIFHEKLTQIYSSFMSGDLIKYMADAGSGILDLVNATDLLKHSILAITALGIGKSITSVGAAITAAAKQYNMFGNALQQVKNLPTNATRVDILEDIGKATKNLTEKNLKLLLSQKQLGDSDRTTILSMHDLKEEQIKQKLEKMGLIAVTKAQSVANAEETATTFTLGGAVTSLKVKMASLGATMKAFFISNPVTATLTILTTAFSIFSTIMANVKQSSEKAAEALENAKSTAQKFRDAISDIQSETQKTAKDAKETAEAYAKLAQSVNTSTNENIKLTNKDYEKFLDLNNQLAKLFPQLTKGYDENGNAILDLGGSVESITGKIAALVEQQERLSKIEIRKNLESYVNGDGENGGQLEVIKGLEKNLSEAENELDVFEAKFDAIMNGRKVNEDFLTGNAKEAAKKFYKEAFGLTEEELEADTVLNHNILGEGVYRFDFGKLEIDESRKQEIIESYNSFYKQLQDDALYAQSELQSANNELSSMMLLWAEDEFAYLSNDEAVQNLMRRMIGSIDWNTLDVSSFAEARQWIQDNILRTIDSISEDDKNRMSEAINKLFTTDLSTLSPTQAKELVDQYIECIAKALGEDDLLELKIRLGFEDTDTIARNYNSVMKKAAEKFSGVNPQYGTHMPVTQEEKELFRQEKAALEAFAEENSINTQDEIAFWNQCIEESETKEEAMKKYLASKFTGDMETPIIPDITSSISQLSTQLEPQLAKLGEAYKSIFTQDGFTLDAVDNTMLEGIRKSFAEIGEEIGVTFDPAQLEPFFEVLTNGGNEDEVQRAFNDLATAYLYSTGTLEQLNGETANAIKIQLEQMGVTNAEEIVAEALRIKNEELALSKKYLALDGKELAETTDSEVLAFMAEQAEAGNCSNALALLQLKKLLVNGTALETEADINNIIRLAKGAGIAAESLAELITLKAAYEKGVAEGNPDTLAMKMTADRIETLKQDFLNKVNNFELNPVGVEFKAPVNDKASGSSSAAKQAETDWKNLLDKETDLLEKQLAANVITFQEYTDKRRRIIEDYYHDGKIKAEDYYDALESMYNSHLSLYDRVIGAVTDRIDEEIDKLKDQKEEIEKSYQVKIDAIQTEIDALNKANDARQKQIDLEKAQYEAERARNQRVNKVYDGGQFIYEADMDTVRDAEDDLADKEFQLNISRLETQIESLKEEMENATKSLDTQVEALEAYKDKWNEISDVYQKQQDKILAAEIMGTEWERDILNGRLDTLRSFTEQYISLQQAQADAAVNAARIKAEAEAGSATGGNVGSVNTGSYNSGNNDNKPKYEVVYEGTAKTVKEFKTLQEAQNYVKRMNKNIADDDFMYYVKKVNKYASGTDNARKGLNLVGEDGTEIFIDNEGNASLVLKPTLIPMEGGEVVKNAEETKDLFHTGHVEQQQSEEVKKLFEYIRTNKPAIDPDKVPKPVLNIPNMNYSSMLGNIGTEHNDVHIDNHISINCPNVTNNSGAEYIMRELKRLPLDTLQYIHRRK